MFLHPYELLCCPTHIMVFRPNRRRVLQSTLALATSAAVIPDLRAASPNEKLNIACIGVGGRGSANVKGVGNENIVAMVDVDEQRAGKAFETHEKSRRFKDYRRMLDAVGNQIDAVVISTPDHTHFHPAYAAMQLGLHVYLEKPLAHNVWETRTLTDFARKQGIATQLGAQRHAIPNMHRVVELIQTGAIGKVTEVHSWVGGSRGMPDIPSETPTPPSTLDYDLWVGPVPNARPYHPSFCPYGWRFWWDFGTGETGNWGCHILDIPYWALGLRYPNRVKAAGPDVDDERTPKAMHCEYQFPESNQNSPVKLHWYHGKPDILKQKGLAGDKEKDKISKKANTLFLGSKGMLLCGFGSHKLLPEEDFKSFKAPDQFIPDSPGFHNEWIMACKGETPATCNFDYSGPLAETVLLGNVAYRTGNFHWDAKTLSTGDNQKAQQLIREEYRPGWEMG